MSIELLMPSNHLFLCCPLLLLPLIFPSISSIQSLSRVQLFVTPWTTTRQASLSITNSCSLPKVMSTPSSSVLFYLLKFAQTQVHWVGDAIQPSHPLPSPSPIAFNLSQHWVFSNEFILFIRGQRIGASDSSSVLPVDIQYWFPLGLTGLISLLSKGLTRVFSSTRFEIINASRLSFLNDPTLTSVHDYRKNIALSLWIIVCKVMSLLFNMLNLSYFSFSGASVF